MKWLVPTVGGSREPILRAIKDEKPDRVAFICSEGSRSLILGDGTRNPTVPMEAGLSEEQYALSIYEAEPDDLSQCYEKITELFRKTRAEDPNAAIACGSPRGTKR